MAFYYLTTCNNLIDAYMLKHMLENEGIPCFLHNEQSANLVPGSVYQVGIQVMVHEINAEKALRLLNQQEEKQTLACPVCYSRNVQKVRASCGVKNFFVGLLEHLYAIPNGRLLQNFTCIDCKYNFRT